MAYLFDGGFTGFLYSMKETGRKLKDGAKELVEDFVSGFNGHGWKLWKRNDSWRLEVDELLVRKSLTTFEMIISQITSIKGSQAITQGNGKIKSVTLVDSADIYKEIKIPTYATDFSVNWNTESLGASNPTISQNEYRIEINEPLDEYQKIFFYGTDVIDKFQFEVSNLNGSISLNYAVNGMEQMDLISTNGTYTFRGSDGTLPSDTKLGISFGKNTTCKIVQMPVVEEYGDSIIQSPCYRIELDNQQNTFTEYDLIRCQKGDKFYYVQIGSVFQYYVNIPVSEFETNDEGIVVNPPQEGDELVQFGNASHQDKYKNRHSAIYLHLDENEPAIDLMTDIYSKDWSIGNIIKTRIGGNLPGTDGDRGFYCVNGKILSVDENGETVYVINPDGSASFARGKLSWTRDGIPYFKGQIIAGDENGKRIEINPNSSTIEIYSDENSLVNIFEGNSYDSPFDLFLGNISDFTTELGMDSWVVSTNTSIDKKDSRIINFIKEKKFNIDSSVVVNVGSIQLSTSINNNIGTFSTNIKLILRSYDSSDNILYEKVFVDETFNRVVEFNISPLNITLSQKGTYAVFIEMTTICKALSSDEFRVYVTVRTNSFDIKKSGYISNFFANGFALGTKEDNIFSVYRHKSAYWGEQMFLSFDNGGVGIDANSYKLKLKGNTKNVDSAPFGLAMKYFAYGNLLVEPSGTTMTDFVSADNTTNLNRAMDKPSTTFYRVTVGYPTTWLAYVLHLSASVEIQVEAYENKQPPTVYLGSETDRNFSFNIYTSTQNWNTFILKFKILLF